MKKRKRRRGDEIDRHPGTQTHKIPFPSFFSLSLSLSLCLSLTHTQTHSHLYYTRPVLLGFTLSAILLTISHQKYVLMP